MTQVDLAVPSLGSSPTQPAFTVLFAISHEALAVPSLGSSPTQQLSGFHAYLAAKYLAVPSLGSSPTQQAIDNHLAAIRITCSTLTRVEPNATILGAWY